MTDRRTARGRSSRNWQPASNPRCHGIKLSRNHGHQHALLAGLLSAPGDALISIDADLQDDESAMKNMVAAHIGGADIVYGVRRARRTDTWFKRVTARGYYRFAALMGVRLVYDHADYRLLSRRAISALAEHRERNVFLRGLIPQLGFNTATVHYDRGERVAGDQVEVKRVKDLTPRDIEHDNPEFRRHDEMIHFLEQIYAKSVSMDDTVTVVRFSQIIERPPHVTDARLGIGGAQN